MACEEEEIKPGKRLPGFSPPLDLEINTSLFDRYGEISATDHKKYQSHCSTEANNQPTQNIFHHDKITGRSVEDRPALGTIVLLFSRSFFLW
jgi:hypothetical protein